MPGDIVILEYHIPADLPYSSDTMPFSINEIVHNYIDITDSFEDFFLKVGTCHNDICGYNLWKTTSYGVAGISSVGGSGNLWCSGGLLASQSNDYTPYFLTAFHCIGSETEAQSAEFHWFYQRDLCSGTVPSPDTYKSAYAKFLSGKSASELSDYALLMILEELPSGVTYLGWDANPLPTFASTPVTGIHHPDGSYKRISLGNEVWDSDTHFHSVEWDSGVTEPGSSGSPLFITEGSNHYVVGQLYAGASSCSYPDGTDQYGEFSSTYSQISSFLAGGSDDSFENNDFSSQAKNISEDSSSNGLIVKKNDEDWYQIYVANEQTLTVNTTFKDAYGDIDIELYDGGTVVDFSETSNDYETVSYTNVSGS